MRAWWERAGAACQRRAERRISPADGPALARDMHFQAKRSPYVPPPTGFFMDWSGNSGEEDWSIACWRIAIAAAFRCAESREPPICAHAACPHRRPFRHRPISPVPSQRFRNNFHKPQPRGGMSLAVRADLAEGRQPLARMSIVIASISPRSSRGVTHIIAFESTGGQDAAKSLFRNRSFRPCLAEWNCSLGSGDVHFWRLWT